MAEPNAVARIGRVIHWAFLGLACLSLAGGVATAVESYRSHYTSLEEIEAWERDTAAKKQLAVKMPPLPEGFEDVNGNDTDLPNWMEGAIPVEEKQERPYEQSAQPEYALFGALIAFILLIVGRALRYILAAE